MTRRDYILVNPMMRNMVRKFDVCYSSIFATHHIPQLEINPGTYVPTITEAVEHDDLAEAFREKVEVCTQGLKGKSSPTAGPTRAAAAPSCYR